MSLVERALKKLQESRATADQGTSGVRRTSSDGKATPEDTIDIPVLSTLKVPGEPVRSPASEKPKRIVQIDQDALRSMELLPPPKLERLIANQYQQVKRELVATALGRSGAAVENGQLIMLASALSGEGKTFTSINLALSLAREKDTEVLLVDADVAKPHLSRLFHLQSEPGLLDLLTDTRLLPDSLIHATDVPGLKLLPAGKPRENSTELLASDRMVAVARELSRPAGHRIVLFDSPPLLLATESRAIASRVGQVVLVVRADSTPQKAVLDALELLGENATIRLILNQTESAPSEGYYGYGIYGDAESGSSNAS